MFILSESEIRDMPPDKQLQIWRQTAAYYQQLVVDLLLNPELYSKMREEMPTQVKGYLQ